MHYTPVEVAATLCCKDRGPHDGQELAFMRDYGKPLALVSAQKRRAPEWQTFIRERNLVVKRSIGRSYLVALPNQRARISMFHRALDMYFNGFIAYPTLEVREGRLLGYTKSQIRALLAYQAQMDQNLLPARRLPRSVAAKAGEKVAFLQVKRRQRN